MITSRSRHRAEDLIVGERLHILIPELDLIAQFLLAKLNNGLDFVS
jgi:hypothetical protein